LDATGLLVDTNGNKVQGKVVSGGEATGALTDINLSDVQSTPEVTTTFAVGANLDSDTETGGQYNTTQTVYDSLGAKHTLNTTFTKTAHSGTGYWGVQCFLDSNQVNTISQDGFVFDADGICTEMYTGDATPTAAIGGGGAGTATVSEVRPGMIYTSGLVKITQTAVAPSATSWSVTSAAYPRAALVSNSTSTATHINVSLDGTGTTDISFDLVGSWDAIGESAEATLTHAAITLGDITINYTTPALAGGATIGSSGNINWNLLGDDSLDITQYSTASVIRALTADGYASGNLKTLSISSEGRISGFFTNGQTSDLAQLMLAQFSNPWGLKKMGSNLFGETVASGSAIQNYPGQSGMGTLTPNTLEMSNTDIATEFIKMITAQKAYQSSARVVTTQDTLMQELMNIKR